PPGAPATGPAGTPPGAPAAASPGRRTHAVRPPTTTRSGPAGRGRPQTTRRTHAASPPAGCAPAATGAAGRPRAKSRTPTARTARAPDRGPGGAAPDQPQ